MIGYLQGELLKREPDRILLLTGQVGYEVLLPAFVMDSLRAKEVGDEIALYIFYQQTERQPKPVLIGFNLEAEKEFFQFFISVEDIGPLKAAKALTQPVREIARAIEAGDVAGLQRLKGIGKRTAQKIVASLQGKMAKFALIREAEPPQLIADVDIVANVMEVLVKQLGHSRSDARQMIEAAMKRNTAPATPEELFEEVYRGERAGAAPSDRR
jgi:Holliday junction DNA helicase RuvA